MKTKVKAHGKGRPPTPRKPFDVKAAIRERKNRRMDRNLANEALAGKRAAEYGFGLEIHNDGHHWVFRKGNFVAEWWPSSANLVLNRDYSRRIHAHEWQQILAELHARSKDAAGKTLFQPDLCIR